METGKKTLIFFIDSLGGGGAERVVSTLSSRLVQSRRYDVRIVTLRSVPIAYPPDGRVQILCAREMPVNAAWGKLMGKALTVYKRLRRSVLKPLLQKLGHGDALPKMDESPFFLYARFAMPIREYLKQNPGCTAFGFLVRSNIALLMAAKGLPVKTVFCERNNPIRPDIPAPLMKRRDRLTRRCHGAVFQTREQRAYYTWLRCPAAVIPNPVKTGLPEPFGGRRRREIVTFCRLHKQKNIPLLLEAFALLRAEHPDITLRIYGRGDEKEHLVALTKRMGLEQSVFFEDFAPDVHERIRDAAMYVCSSDFEGLSNAMLEALAIGLPCVCTDCEGGGARMMIRDHENGILVPVRDPGALYRGMKEVLEDPALSRRLSAAAAKVREELSIENIVGQWETITG